MIGLLALLLLTTLPSITLAEEYAQPAGSESPDRTFLATANGQLLLSTTDMCGQDLDVVICISKPNPLLGFAASMDLLLSRFWAVGLLGGAHWKLASSKSVDGCDTGSCVLGQDNFMLWRMAVEARLYPKITDKVKVWLAFEFGMAGAVDSYESTVDGVDQPTDYARDYAPELGLGAGLDFTLVQGLFLELEMRGLLLMFGDPASKPAGSSVTPTDIGAAFWPLFGVLSLGYAWDI